jgi:hypothetical protein
MEFGERGKRKDNGKALIISHNVRCEDKEYKNVY